MPALREDSARLQVSGREVCLRFRRSARAKRLILRLAPAEGCFVLTLPPGVSREAGLAFARRQGDWIQKKLEALPAPVPFVAGARLPLLGVHYTIRHRPHARRGVWREAGDLCVSGRREHLARRTSDYLRREARLLLRARAEAKWVLLPPEVRRPLRQVRVRDTVSRWGSCSAAGNLSFSWRLIFAPDPVFDYVVAHEVAHLVHMNHSAAFWELNRQLTPDLEQARQWLRDRGAGLLRYG